MATNRRDRVTRSSPGPVNEIPPTSEAADRLRIELDALLSTRQAPQDPEAVRAMVRDQGGSKAVAARLGVTQRTVQRYMATDATQRRKPSPAMTAKLTAGKIGSATVAGVQGVSSTDSDYWRRMAFTFGVSDARMRAMVAAHVRGDDAAAAAELNEAARDTQPNWYISDPTSIEFRP